MKKTLKLLLAMIMVLGMVFTININGVKAEEQETCEYDLDMAYWDGNPDAEYEYSFDKVNWSTEHTWNLVVGEEYTVWVRRPSGKINPVNFIALPAASDVKDGKEGNIDSEKTETIEETTSENSSEKIASAEETSVSEAETTQHEPKEQGNGFTTVLIIVIVFLTGGIAFMLLKNNKKDKK